MVHLIDKSALVAEIKRLIDCCYKMCAGDLDFLQRSYPEHYYSIETYKEILSFLDTLEVKEVDLDEEIMKYQREIFDRDTTVSDVARHFAQWQKEKTMAKAIDAHCFGFQGDALFSFTLPADNYLVGSKVKVILIEK